MSSCAVDESVGWLVQVSLVFFAFTGSAKLVVVEGVNAKGMRLACSSQPTDSSTAKLEFRTGHQLYLLNSALQVGCQAASCKVYVNYAPHTLYGTIEYCFVQFGWQCTLTTNLQSTIHGGVRDNLEGICMKVVGICLSHINIISCTCIATPHPLLLVSSHRGGRGVCRLDSQTDDATCMDASLERLVRIVRIFHTTKSVKTAILAAR